MSSCSIKWCGKNTRTSNYKTDGVTFHRFPKDPEKKKIWIETTGRNRDWVPAKTSVVCSRHFTDDCFNIMENKRRLFNFAVPTLFLPPLNSAVEGETANLNTLKQKHVSQEYEPDAYTSLTEKRFCRRIIDLTAKNKNSDVKIKKLRDTNRNLKKKLASLFDELEEKMLKTDKNTSLLNSIGVKCQEIRQKLKRSVSSDDSMSADELNELLSDDDNSSENTQHTSIAQDKDKGSGHIHEGCYCNECSAEISGFRYVCVQCTDLDLCSACEAKGVHGLHYVLRVPGWRASEEITSVLEKIRGELFRREGNVQSIEIEIKAEPEPLEQEEEIYINTDVSDSQLMRTTSRVTTSEAAIREADHQTNSDIPNKKRKMEMEEFLSFKHKSDSSHRTAHPESVLLNTENLAGFVTTSNIKIEPDISEESTCDVFVHKDSGQCFSGSTMTGTDLGDPGTAGSSLSTALASDVTTRARPVLCIGLEPGTAAPQTQHGTSVDAQLSCPTTTASGYFVDVAGADRDRPK